jgi:hypothetical protein
MLVAILTTRQKKHLVPGPGKASVVKMEVHEEDLKMVVQHVRKRSVREQMLEQERCEDGLVVRS